LLSSTRGVQTTSGYLVLTVLCWPLRQPSSIWGDDSCCWLYSCLLNWGASVPKDQSTEQETFAPACFVTNSGPFGGSATRCIYLTYIARTRNIPRYGLERPQAPTGELVVIAHKLGGELLRERATPLRRDLCFQVFFPRAVNDPDWQGLGPVASQRSSNSNQHLQPAADARRVTLV